MAWPAIMTRLRFRLHAATRFVRNFIERQPASRLFLVGAALFLVAFMVIFAVNALANALMFDGYAADGAFQLMNPLRRLAGGEVIGRDFQFFHGIGVPLLHLPFYYLFGANGLFASEMARWLVSPGLFLVSTFVFFYSFRKKWQIALSLTVFVTGAAMLVVPYLVLPLTSLLGVRSTVPVLLLALMMQQEKLQRPLFKKGERLRSITLYEALTACLLAVGFICGTEFGIAALLAFCVAHVVYKTDAKLSRRTLALSLVRILAMFAVLLLALFTVLTAGHPFEPIKYALVDIPTDQFWYFGVPPNHYLNLSNLTQEISHDGLLLIMWSIALIAAILMYKVHSFKINRILSQAFLFALLAGAFGMVSMLGYYHNSEAASLARMALLVGTASSVLLWARWKKPVRLGFEVGRLKKRFGLYPQAGLTILGILFIVSALVFGVCSVFSLRHNYNVKGVAVKTRDYVLGKDTNVLGDDWTANDNALMPIIQADNNVPIADVNDSDYQHGASTKKAEVIVSAGDKAQFIKPGQIVYFAKADRQIIKSVQKRGKDMLVTLQNAGVRLDPTIDGAPHTMIVAEDFNHDNSKLWSTYSGLLESEMKTHNASSQGYDYIIHALGPQRRQQYIDDFNRVQPKFVTTFSRVYFLYEEWLQNAHWDFYSLVDKNYEVAAQTSTYILWKKRDQSWIDARVQQHAWQPLGIDAAQRKINLQYAPFDQVPDLEAYGQAQMQAERERQRALGKPIATNSFASEEEYNQQLIGKDRTQRNATIRERENAGLETDALEHQAWEQEIAAAQTAQNAKNTDAPQGAQLYVPRPKRQVILVKLHYQLSHPFQSVPLFGKTTRYFVEPNNVYWHTPISLKPYANEITFPMTISEWNKDPYIRLNSYSLLPGQGTIKITGAEWAPLETTEGNLKVLTD